MTSVLASGPGRKVSLTLMRQQERGDVGGFSDTTKMPWLSWSIPAQLCQTGSRLHEVEGSVCHGCYALKGNYRYQNVKDALTRRFEMLMEDIEAWTADMARHLRERAERFIPTDDDRFPAFRWHDSGDIQSVAHLEGIANVCLATQDVTLADKTVSDVYHWLPTREYEMVTAWLKGGGVVPRNLDIRLSAHMVDGPAPVKLARKHGLNVSTVHSDDDSYPDASLCPAYRQGGQCKSCRSCWDRDVFHVSYPKH